MVGSIDRQTELKAQSAGGAISLRHPRWADFEAWISLRRESLEYLRPWEPDISERGLNRASYRGRLTRLKKLMQQDRAYPFHIFRETTLIGACNVTHIDRGMAQSARLGYWIGERFTGRGFARAAVQSVSSFCFDNLRLHRIEAAVQSDNPASIKVLQTAGFQFEGTARSMLKIDGKWRDHDIYARLSID